MIIIKQLISAHAKRLWIVFSDAVSSFRKNNDFGAASSLAFSATLALIPALFLLTVLLGAAVGSSQKALLEMQEFVNTLIPRYSSEILSEVRQLTAHTKTIGILNGIVLLWIITPLVSGIRVSLSTIFRTRPNQPFLLEKIVDFAITGIVVVIFAASAVSGVVFTVGEKMGISTVLPRNFGNPLSFLFVAAVVAVFYLIFSKRMPTRYLFVGALVCAALWSSLHPVFNTFLTYNPGYGLAFGSFKSLFIVIIWIYYSLAVFMFGAEVAASFNREELIVIRSLINRNSAVPGPVLEKLSIPFAKGNFVFAEGDPGNEMYLVLRGEVGIQKNGKDVAIIRERNYFGEMSFLLSEPRSASAVALTDVDLLVINNKTIINLVQEYPELVFWMLKEMAGRLRETTKQIA